MNTGSSEAALDASAFVLDELLLRVQAEFLEMPGLRVTRAQARRLWALDHAVVATAAQDELVRLERR
jgi:hypothetical protein